MVPPASAHAIAPVLAQQTGIPPVDTADARERAKTAIQKSNSHTAMTGESTPSDDPTIGSMQARERSIPRKFDLPDFQGCNNFKPPKTPDCTGCGACNNIQPPTNLSTAGSIIQWILVVLAACAIVYLILRILRSRMHPIRGSQREHALVRQARTLPESAVDDAIKAGDYDAAIHAIFILTLLQLTRCGTPIRHDWTPREIPRHVFLDTQRKEALHTLVLLAERARFSTYTSNKADLGQAQRAAERIHDTSRGDAA